MPTCSVFVFCFYFYFFFGIYLTWVFSELPGSVAWCLTLTWENSQSLLLQILLLFLSLFFFFSYSHYVCITSFVIVPQFLDSVFPCTFSLYLSVLEVSSQSLKLRDYFLSHIQSTNEYIKVFFVSIFLISNIFFFLKISISLLTLSICSCMMSTFFIKALHTLTTVFKNSWCDSSNIRAIFDSESNTCSVSLNCLNIEG